MKTFKIERCRQNLDRVTDGIIGWDHWMGSSDRIRNRITEKIQEKIHKRIIILIENNFNL